MSSELILAGWYVAVEADQGEHLSPAALQSPIMRQASASCTLHFYYNMYGEGRFFTFIPACVQQLKETQTNKPHMF